MHSFSLFFILLCNLLDHVIASNGTQSTDYWLENIKHQGLSPFNPDPSSYQVFRNVKDFGAKGDGVTDDTAAINLAISSGDRCAPGSCNSTTTTPAIIYFPGGTYLLSASIIDFYLTQLIGNPNDLPVLKATSSFSSNTSFGLIDGDPSGANGLQFQATNIFYRQVRNFVFDLRDVPASVNVTGIHWPTSQATSLQNCVFRMSDAIDTQHRGIYIESGSGGFMNDLVFHGGSKGVVFGNQQFTTRNLTFNNAKTAISQLWDWGWTYSGVAINNCSVGLEIGGGGTAAGSITFIDSSIRNTPIGILNAHVYNASSLAATAGSIVMENVLLNKVAIAVKGSDNSTVLRGTNGTSVISGWGQGHSYTPNGPESFKGSITPFSRPSSLLDGKSFYKRSKPQYENIPLSQFSSVRDGGAFGDGLHDDTDALQRLILLAAKQNKVVFFDAGIYKVENTIYIPPNSKIVGESYPTIMGSGAFFSNPENPQPVVQVGHSFENGTIEWSDMIVSTQGATAGAILIEFNLASPSSSPSGMWDVHARVGGFAGSNLQVAQCEKTPELLGLINPECIAAFMTMHVTKSAAGLYMENVWLWVADHDLEDQLATQITIYNGRGLYVESEAGTIWLVGTGVEHHQMYQYQFANTKDIFMGQIQTETPYYQPSPNALLPFLPVDSLNDPDFAISCAALPGNCDAWGLRIIDSDSILVYGAGLYSFFDNYNTTCSAVGNGAVCQNQIFSIEGTVSNVSVYNLNTIGASNMITWNGTDIATFADNVDSMPGTIASFKSN